MAAEDEDVVALKEQVALKDTTVKKKNEDSLCCDLGLQDVKYL